MKKIDFIFFIFGNLYKFYVKILQSLDCRTSFDGRKVFVILIRICLTPRLYLSGYKFSSTIVVLVWGWYGRSWIFQNISDENISMMRSPGFKVSVQVKVILNSGNYWHQPWPHTTPSIYWIINSKFWDISPGQDSCKLFKIIDTKYRLLISNSKSRAEARRDKFSDNGNYSNNCQPSLSFCRYEWSVFVQTNGLFLKKVTQTRSYFIDANRDKHLFVLHTPQSLQASCCLWTYCSMLQWKFSITDKRSLGKVSSVCIHGQNFYFLFLFDLA